MTPNARVLLVALAAGVLGVLASLLTSAPGRWMRTEWGQRVFAEVQRAAPTPAGGPARARPGAIIPALVLPDLTGRGVRIPADFQGKPLLLNVWASWCAPCVHEMPLLERFSREQAGNLQVVGIALDDDPAAVRDFLQRTGVSYRVLIDTPRPTDAGVRLGNPKGVLPYSVLVSPSGVLLKQRFGPFARGELAPWVLSAP